jgi:integrase
VPLTLEQAHIFLESVRDHRLEELLAMAVVTGMRRGEMVALRWADVDLERRTLLVRRTVDYIARFCSHPLISPFNSSISIPIKQD